MSAQHILLERHDYVAVLRMNRVDKKNALTQAMYNELAENLTTVAADDSLRALVIAGHATCFCAGNDLADFLQTPPNSQDSPVARFMRALAAFEKPVIAAPAGEFHGDGPPDAPGGSGDEGDAAEQGRLVEGHGAIPGQRTRMPQGGKHVQGSGEP